jgi:hypothetical protein
LLLGLANIGGMIVAAGRGSWGVTGVAAVVGLILTVKNVGFIMPYTARVLELKWWQFYPTSLGGVVATVVVSLCMFGVTQVWCPDTWLELAALASLATAVYSFIVYVLVLSDGDSELLRRVLTPFRLRLRALLNSGFLPLSKAARDNNED